MPQPFRNSGELWDSSTNCDPSVVRFISEDSYKGDITNPLSLNLYTYVENNPLIYTDPLGNSPKIHKEEVAALIDKAYGSKPNSSNDARDGDSGYYEVIAQLGSIAIDYMPSEENNDFIFEFNFGYRESLYS